MKPQLLFLELNEVNFDYVQRYCAEGRLPHFGRLLRDHQLVSTSSEHDYADLEPWIQWVTAHTGLSRAEHGIFRLGDIVKRDLPQIWEVLESQGLSVGAVSPMNAKHRLRSPAFFVPDPWTATAISAPPILKRLYSAIAQAVNDNAQAKLTPASVLGLALGLARYAQPRSYRRYVELALSSRSHPWRKAIFLDQLLADVFVREVARTRPHFATLFLNAAAHIQHHYMFSSTSYTGPQRNPDWYAPTGVDPLFEVYDSYDRIVGELRAKYPAARLMLATGLHQVPHEEVTFYWRLRDHGQFLRGIGVEFVSCEPRMSRDFLVTAPDEQAAERAAAKLLGCLAADGKPLFSVDNRGCDLFVTLVYSKAIESSFRFHLEGVEHLGFDREVAFVALKNGEHHGAGYFLDTGMRHDEPVTEFPLSDVPARVARAFGLTFPSGGSGAVPHQREVA